MSTAHQKTRFFLKRWFVGNIFLAGFFSLMWLLLRSGTRPSRLAYPCQQAAVTTASLAFGAPLVGALIAARFFAGRLIRDRRVLAAAAGGLFVTIGLLGCLSRSTASSTYGPLPPANYRAEVFHITDCPPDPVGDRFPGLDSLLRLMGEHDRKFYRSTTVSPLSGPDGIIASDDVVVIKINYQWTERGGTNIDVLRGLIRLIVDHPDGFTGEVVVCENAQSAGASGFDRTTNNAQDQGLSPRDVAIHFSGLGYTVSMSDWSAIRNSSVTEYSSGDLADGYVVYDYDAQLQGRVSYPKFQTDNATYVSLKDGIWDPVGSAYDRDRLKVINVPVLKPHGYQYGATACVKNFMGLVTNYLDTNSHDATEHGLMGAVMGEIGPPDLNILDCIWINDNPSGGPMTSYAQATRRDELVASIDPVAADLWAVTNILIPAFLDNGFTPPWPSPDATPDDPNSDFRTYLDRSMEKLLASGYSVTNDIDSIDVYSSTASIRRPAPRRPSGRVMPERPESEKVLRP